MDEPNIVRMLQMVMDDSKLGDEEASQCINFFNIFTERLRIKLQESPTGQAFIGANKAVFQSLSGLSGSSRTPTSSASTLNHESTKQPKRRRRSSFTCNYPSSKRQILPGWNCSLRSTHHFAEPVSIPPDDHNVHDPISGSGNSTDQITTLGSQDDSLIDRQEYQQEEGHQESEYWGIIEHDTRNLAGNEPGKAGIEEGDDRGEEERVNMEDIQEQHEETRAEQDEIMDEEQDQVMEIGGATLAAEGQPEYQDESDADSDSTINVQPSMQSSTRSSSDYYTCRSLASTSQTSMSPVCSQGYDPFSEPLSRMIMEVNSANGVDEVARLVRGRTIKLGQASGWDVTILPEETSDFFNRFQPRAKMSTTDLKAMFATMDSPESFKLLDPLDIPLHDRESFNDAVQKSSDWELAPHHEFIMVPRYSTHWTLIVATLRKSTAVIKHYDFLGAHTIPCYPCEYVKFKINHFRSKQKMPSRLWTPARPEPTLPKHGASSNDCAVYVARTAELLFQQRKPLQEPDDKNASLRLHYLKRIVRKSFQEEPNFRLQNALNPPRKVASEWMNPKKALLLCESEQEVESVEPVIRATSAKDDSAEQPHGSHLFSSWVSAGWAEEVGRIAAIPYRDQPLGRHRAYDLLKLAAGLGAPRYLAELGSVVAYMRSRATAPRQPGDNDIFFYRMGKMAQENKLLASIRSRLVHQYYAATIEKRAMELKAHGSPSRTLPVNMRNQENSGQALTRAIQQVAKGIVHACYPQHEKPGNPIHAEVQRTIRDWRKRGLVWVALGHRFGTQLIPLLAPAHVRLGPEAEEVRASDYERLPGGLLPILADAVVRLRPRLSEHFPGLVNFYILLQDPGKLAAEKRLRIEFVSGKDIEVEDLDSDVLTTLFNVLEPAKEVTEPLSATPLQIS